MLKNILVIDDEKHIRDSFKIRLEQEGYKVDVAEDGDIGLKMVSDNIYDVVITDIVMPEKEGLEVIREIRSQNAGIKIIAISGGGRISPDNYLNMAKLFGAENIFKKPVILEDLIKVIEG